MSHQPLDPLDHLLVQVDRSRQLRRALVFSNHPDEVVSLARDLGIDTTKDELSRLLNGEGDSAWVCGGEDFNPVEHLKRIFVDS